MCVLSLLLLGLVGMHQAQLTEEHHAPADPAAAVVVMADESHPGDSHHPTSESAVACGAIAVCLSMLAAFAVLTLASGRSTRVLWALPRMPRWDLPAVQLLPPVDINQRLAILRC
ncbi:hypothetical protein HMPREF0063_12095 [Aeromicrobium marinum DSM 15272]|uniref:Tat pathway signal sequence domain protein n=1 Tax=Aeromicrobium marinum DSM 15272 TaxID=585531 RepID=E2SCD3_9ACTN|nr:hypothetical protein [Aeromicrobium marinum]EFQ82886.1 hypothetical protein HMPREF0063_12095 [Aeromicrobium marinum DSM 15272]